jgi:hypothetical protein
LTYILALVRLVLKDPIQDEGCFISDQMRDHFKKNYDSYLAQAKESASHLKKVDF